MKRLLVLGASGACGQWVTRLAAARGHSVTAVKRPESPYRPPHGVRVVSGSVTDPVLLGRLIGSAEVVVSCLGLRRRSVLPWSPLLSPPDLIQQVTEIVVGVPHAQDLERFVWISAGGVGDSRPQATAAIRLMIDTGTIAAAYRDLGRAERALSRSPVPALAVRPVTLRHGPPTGGAGPVSRYGAFSTVRRSDVATWILDVVEGTASYSQNAVLLGRAFRS